VATTALTQIRELVGQLSESELEDLLDYIQLQLDPDELTADEANDVEQARAEISRGESVTLDEYERKRSL
jgi:hypothetical protein